MRTDMQAISKWIALAAVAAVLVHAAVGTVESTADGLVLLAALLAGGAILARLPLAGQAAVAAGLFAVADAVFGLLRPSAPVALESAYLVAAMVLIASGFALLRRSPTGGAG